MHLQSTKSDKEKQPGLQMKAQDAEHTTRTMAPPPFQLKAKEEAEKTEGETAQLKTATGNAPVQMAKKDSFPWEGVTLGSAAVHTAKGDTGEAQATLVKGTKVSVTESQDGYVKVSAKVGDKTVEGWVLSTLVEDPTIARLNQTVEAVSDDMNQMWKDSFNADETVVEEHGRAIVEKEGKISATNDVTGGSGSVVIDHSTKDGETLIGDIHTHPYSKSEGSALGVGFSSGDITSMRGLVKQGYQRLVEAGTARFAMVITDEAKALEFYKNNSDGEIDKKWNDTFSASTGNFQQAVIEAVKAVLGENGANGISFYQTSDTDKKQFGEL